MTKFIKRNAVVEAFQLPAEGDLEAQDFLAWAERVGFEDYESGRYGTMVIYTSEGDMIAEPGDWIIKGIAGEFYPCKPDIFSATYEPLRQFRHLKSGGIYTFLHEALREADQVPVIVYRGDDGRIWVRPSAEFFDGRFEELAS